MFSTIALAKREQERALRPASVARSHTSRFWAIVFFSEAMIGRPPHATGGTSSRRRGSCWIHLVEVRVLGGGAVKVASDGVPGHKLMFAPGAMMPPTRAERVGDVVPVQVGRGDDAARAVACESAAEASAMESLITMPFGR